VQLAQRKRSRLNFQAIKKPPVTGALSLAAADKHVAPVSTLHHANQINVITNVITPSFEA
jgi:hypothetical protein